MSSHSRIGASSLHRWKECPGSVKLCATAPNIPSKYAEEGTLAHEFAAHALESKLGSDGKMPDHEMLPHIILYRDTIFADVRGKKHEMFVEKSFSLPHVHPDAFGTADCIVYFPNEKHLKVYDFKYGAGVKIEAENNLQLHYYALGAAYAVAKPVTSIELIIIQPRFDEEKIRRHTIDAVIDLIEFESNLREWALATEEKNAPLKVGKWCFFCNAKNLCPAQKQRKFMEAALEFEAL